MDGCRELDVSAAQLLEKVLTNAISQALNHDTHFICVFSGCNKRVEVLLERMLDWEELHFFHSVHSAVTFVEDVLAEQVSSDTQSKEHSFISEHSSKKTESVNTVIMKSKIIDCN